MAPNRRRIMWVVVADGEKALLFENAGTRAQPDLKLLSKRELDIPPSREIGSDKPGRFPDAGPGQRSATEITDWHQQEEDRFVHDVTERLNKLALKNRFEELVLMADPRVLGNMRARLSKQVAERIVVEVPKDLTKHPVSEIEKHLARALGF